MRNIMRPCNVVKMQKSHSITLETVPFPTTKNPRAHVIPKMGTSTSEACSSVLGEEGGKLHAR